jgi:hypothetical protein
MPIMGLEFRPSAGILPPNFNVNLVTSDEPTPTPGASDFLSWEWMKREGEFSWLTLFKLLLALLVIVLMALLLA